MSRIFISHSSFDNHQALAFRDWLSREGWSKDSDVYLDIHPDSGMAAGERWVAALREAASRCEVVVFLVSQKWLESEWCREELALAKHLNKKIFTLLVEDIALDRLPPGLSAEWQIVRLMPVGSEATEEFEVSPDPLKPIKFVRFARDGLVRLTRGLHKAGVAADTFELQPDANSAHGWRSPYRGLEPLEKEDAAVFFGRDADILRFLGEMRRLRTEFPMPMLVVLGASGSGKSSFLRAGVLPRLIRDDDSWVALSAIRVADHGALDGAEGLLEALAAAWDRLGEEVNRADLREALTAPPAFVEHLELMRVAAAKRALLPDDATKPLPVLLLDQAEELDAADAGPEANVLLALIKAAIESGNLIVIATIRSDSFDVLAARAGGISKCLFPLEPIASAEISQVIRRPGEILRAKIGDKAPLFTPEAVAQLQKDIEGERDALPLLAFVMQRLVAEYAFEPSIGVEQLNAIGGFSGAIEAAATQSLRSAGFGVDLARDKAALRAVFVPRLVRIDPVTREARRRVSSLSVFDDSEMRPLVGAFIEQRLLVTHRVLHTVEDGEPADPVTTRDTTVEITHEALLRQWPALVLLLNEEAGALAVLDSVQLAAAEWQKAREQGERGGEYLVHKGERLEEAKRMLQRGDFAEFLDESSLGYLKACGDAERLRSRLVIGVIAFVVALIAFAGLKQYENQQQAQLFSDKELAQTLVRTQGDLDGRIGDLLRIENEGLPRPRGMLARLLEIHDELSRGNEEIDWIFPDQEAAWGHISEETTAGVWEASASVLVSPGGEMYAAIRDQALWLSRSDGLGPERIPRAIAMPIAHSGGDCEDADSDDWPSFQQWWLAESPDLHRYVRFINGEDIGRPESPFVAIAMIEEHEDPDVSQGEDDDLFTVYRVEVLRPSVETFTLEGVSSARFNENGHLRIEQDGVLREIRLPSIPAPMASSQRARDLAMPQVSDVFASRLIEWRREAGLLDDETIVLPDLPDSPLPRACNAVASKQSVSFCLGYEGRTGTGAAKTAGWLSFVDGELVEHEIQPPVGSDSPLWLTSKVSPNGNVIVTWADSRGYGDRNPVWALVEDGTEIDWLQVDDGTGAILCGEADCDDGISFSPDGKRMLSLRDNGVLKLVTLDVGRLVDSLRERIAPLETEAGE